MTPPRVSQVNARKLGWIGAQGALAAFDGKSKEDNRYRLKGGLPCAVTAWDAGFEMADRWSAKRADAFIRRLEGAA